MKKLLFIITTLIASLSASFSQNYERVSPVYGSDNQANEMIRYISENLTLEIPEDRSTKDVNGYMSCKISIDPSGRIADINITHSAVRWLDIVIVEGLRKIPPSRTWQSNKTTALKRQLIFTFGNGRAYRKPIYGFNQEGVKAQINGSVDQWQKHLQDSLRKHWGAWNDKTTLDMKLDMPLSPSKSDLPHGVIQNPDIKAPQNDIPNIEVSFE